MPFLVTPPFRLKNPALVAALGVLSVQIFPYLSFTNLILLLLFSLPIALLDAPLFLASLLFGYFNRDVSIFNFDWSEIFAFGHTFIKGKICANYSPSIASFFQTFFMGEAPEPTTGALFRSLGLSHLLAISGFHFQSILSTFDVLAVRFVKGKPYFYLLMLIATGYFTIVEGSPSVLRSFISLILALLAPTLGRVSSPMNTFYLSFLLVFICNPKKILETGSVLSFLATFGILNYTNFFLRILGYRGKTSFYRFPSLLHSLKKTFFNILSLQLSVMVTTLPYIFLKIGGFGPIALLTNFLIPPLMVPTFYLFVLSLFFPFLSPVCENYTEKILSFLELVPRPLTFSLSLPGTFDQFLETAFLLVVALPILRSCYKTPVPV
jgi:ComEC/Rec2-related protein